MPNQVTSHTHTDGVRNVVMTFTGVADGSGVQETNVKKVDVTAMLPPGSRSLKIRTIRYSIQGGIVRLLWDAPSPKEFADLSGFGGSEDYTRFGGLVNDAPSATGSILLSTLNFVLGSSYNITLEMTKGQ